MKTSKLKRIVVYSYRTLLMLCVLANSIMLTPTFAEDGKRASLLIKEMEGNVSYLNLTECQRLRFSENSQLLAAFHYGYLCVWRVEGANICQIWNQNLRLKDSEVTDFCWSNNLLIFGIVIRKKDGSIVPNSSKTMLLNPQNDSVNILNHSAYIQYLANGENLCMAGHLNETKNLRIDFYRVSNSKAYPVGHFEQKSLGNIDFRERFVTLWDKEARGVFACIDNSKLDNYVYISKEGIVTKFLPKNAKGAPLFLLGSPMPVIDYEGRLNCLISYFEATPVVARFSNLKVESETLLSRIFLMLKDISGKLDIVTFSPNGRFLILKQDYAPSSPFYKKGLSGIWALDVKTSRRKLIGNSRNTIALQWNTRGLLLMGYDPSTSSSSYVLLDFKEAHMKDEKEIDSSISSGDWTIVSDLPPQK